VPEAPLSLRLGSGQKAVKRMNYEVAVFTEVIALMLYVAWCFKDEREPVGDRPVPFWLGFGKHIRFLQEEISNYFMVPMHFIGCISDKTKREIEK
jgi:hypothetical protein